MRLRLDDMLLKNNQLHEDHNREVMQDITYVDSDIIDVKYLPTTVKNFDEPKSSWNYILHSIH